MKKAMIALSGGVDSSMAAYFTQLQGYECIGVTMHLYDSVENNRDNGKSCCSLQDTEDARKIAEKLGMPFQVLDLKNDFRDIIIKNFVSEYIKGRTPNPCIQCNKYMKFDKLLEKAKELGCEKIVTGHYARVVFDGNKYLLKKAEDDTKDQSYVLYNLTQDQLAHVMFPLGDKRKVEIRDLAEKEGFSNARKADSQDICFVPDGDYAKLVEDIAGVKSKAGKFVDTEGNVLGKHKGIINYTVGQRRGLGISSKEPLYVCRISKETNEVILGSKKDLFSKELTACNFNWTLGEKPELGKHASAKIRYRHKEEPCVIYANEDETVKIIFDEPQRAITPGQSVVVYDGDVVLGGGIII